MQASEPLSLLVLGDSLSAAYGIDASQGWVALLEERIIEKRCPLRVVNASISGDTTRGALARLPTLIDRERPDIVIVALGGNDGLRGLSFDETRRSLDEIVSRSRKSGARVLLAGIHVPPNYGRAFTERFHAIFHEVAVSHDVPLLPFLLEGIAEERSLMQADGLHPTAVAQPLILDNIWPSLAPLTGCR